MTQLTVNGINTAKFNSKFEAEVVAKIFLKLDPCSIVKVDDKQGIVGYNRNNVIFI